MALDKEWKEFHTIDLTKGWEVPLGYPSGIQQQILAGKLDESNKRGSRMASVEHHSSPEPMLADPQKLFTDHLSQ